MKRRIFVSVTSNVHLDERRLRLKAAVIAKIEASGFEVQEFWESGIPSNLAWNFSNVGVVMRRCVGAVIFGFPRWSVSSNSGATGVTGEYNHYEGAVALTYDLPLFLMAEEGVQDRGIIWTGGGKAITFVPINADVDWLESRLFVKRFEAWKTEIEERRDIFLGYCSKSQGTAAIIQNMLSRQGATVLDWAMDFQAGGSILERIEDARRKCSAGIFLFSEDDPLEGVSGSAAPRDNVVFEAGYFMSAKGPDRCLIIRQGKAKMPADVGGAIYLSFTQPSDVMNIEGRLAKFVRDNL